LTRASGGLTRIVVIGIVVIIIVLAAVTGIFVVGKLSVAAPSVPSLQQSESMNEKAVLAIIPTFVGYLNDRDIESLSNYYTNTSVVLWSGTAAGLQGIYSGENYIRILYVSSLSHMDRLVATSSDINATASAPKNVTVTMTLKLNGHSTVIGNLSAVVDVTQVWSNARGNWTIQNENWDYVTFIAATTGSATVFPQWGLTLEGKNPNLASEHLLEWYAAPYVAGAIYGSIVAIFALTLIVRFRKQKKVDKSLE
jgi:hypothetical protein